MGQQLVIYVDVDDTLVRNVGAKRIPMPSVVTHVRELFEAGVTLYCWSSGGADYSQSTAGELGIADCFVGFLPKPNVIIDDQNVAEWRHCVEVGPLTAASSDAGDYRRLAELSDS